jgi:hypothetical protein
MHIDISLTNPAAVSELPCKFASEISNTFIRCALIENPEYMEWQYLAMRFDSCADCIILTLPNLNRQVTTRPSSWRKRLRHGLLANPFQD